MEKETFPFIISIAAVSGGGKTTIASQLNKKLPKSRVLLFDDYDFEGPNDLIEWVDQGADYNEWNLSTLIDDIVSLLNEKLDYIVLDFPFAYQHERVRKYIDYAVFIDTPLDIAMARRINRDFSNESSRSILNDMETYVARGRRGYLEMLKTIKPNSDIIVDGNLSILEIVNKIIRCLEKYRTKQK